MELTFSTLNKKLNLNINKLDTFDIKSELSKLFTCYEGFELREIGNKISIDNKFKKRVIDLTCYFNQREYSIYKIDLNIARLRGIEIKIIGQDKEIDAHSTCALLKLTDSDSKVDLDDWELSTVFNWLSITKKIDINKVK